MSKRKKLNALKRTKCIAELQEQEFDLIIIGGGITGAGIALDAASRGLNTVLFEKQDFGAGTSSRSTKLIHGGLRYLKQLEIGLVREVGTERALLHDNAPHLVHPKRMLLPIIENGSLGKRSTSLGLLVYDWLTGVERDERRSMHAKEKTLDMEPLLREEVVIGGGLYYEYQTDDARLTVEVLKTAGTFGATALSYAEVNELIYGESGKLIGVKVQDHISQETFNVFAKKIVNACGPWVDTIRRKDSSINEKRLHLTKGIHLVVPYERFPIQQAVYFDVEDGRMIFAIPRGDTTYFGTTDTNYTDELERPQVEPKDVTYLINAVNFMFPSLQITTEDIISSWAGLRPLIHEEGKSPSELSRKDEIFYSSSGLISIAGGKLTGFRKMAERTVDAVVKRLFREEGRKIQQSVTDIIPLSGGNFTTPDDLPDYIDDLVEIHQNTDLDRKMIHDLVYKYGKNTEKVIRIALEEQAHITDPSARLLLAELYYGIRREMILTPCDFFIRRTGALYFEPSKIQQFQNLVIQEMTRIFDWTPQQKKAYLAELQTEVKAVLAFQKEMLVTVKE